MVAQYTVKIGDKWYRAGDTIPDYDNDKKAVSVKAEPPIIENGETVEEVKPQKRRYKRRS